MQLDFSALCTGPNTTASKALTTACYMSEFRMPQGARLALVRGRYTLTVTAPVKPPVSRPVQCKFQSVGSEGQLNLLCVDPKPEAMARPAARLKDTKR